jgi:hypothetical protein
LLSCALLAGIYLPAIGIGAWSPRSDGKPAHIEAAADRIDALGEPTTTELALGMLRPDVAAANATRTAAEPEKPGDDGDAAEAETTTEAAPPEPTPDPRPESVLAKNQLVVFYGTPLASGLGILGMYSPDEAAQRVVDQAAAYDALNGDRGAKPTLDLIYALAMDEPTPNGLYIRYLNDETVRRYIEVAERYDLQLMLDLQIGRGHIPEEVRKIERFLLHPRVHVAIDPEYAVGPEGAPIVTPGQMSGHEINEVQRYLAELGARHNLPPKVLVVHQFMEETVVEVEATEHVDGVELVLNMDAFGALHEKERKYRYFASLPHAKRKSYNIFLKQDERTLTEAEVLELSPQPDAVFYQ